MIGFILIIILSVSLLVYVRYRNDIRNAYERIGTGRKMIHTECGPIQYTEYVEGTPMLIVHGAGGGYDQGEYFAKIIGGIYRFSITSSGAISSVSSIIPN